MPRNLTMKGIEHMAQNNMLTSAKNVSIMLVLFFLLLAFYAPMTSDWAAAAAEDKHVASIQNQTS